MPTWLKNRGADAVTRAALRGAVELGPGPASLADDGLLLGFER